jgi:NADH-quinone oxidoreductase subunit J
MSKEACHPSDYLSQEQNRFAFRKWHARQIVSMVIFFILAIVAVVAALMVISTKKPVSSALFLVLVMCSLAGLFVLLGAVFLAALQIIVYAGAIMVLFLFVIMLLNLRRDEFGHDPYRFQKYLGIVFVLIILLQGVFIIHIAMKEIHVGNVNVNMQTAPTTTADSSAVLDYNSAPVVAETLFTKFAYPFEITSILLLAAIIGAVVIARKRRPDEIEKKAES